MHMASKVLSSILLATTLNCLLSAQTAKTIVVPNAESFTPSQQIPFKYQPADLELVPQAPGARKGRLWVRNIGHALAIDGEVDGDAPVWPRNKNHILEADHVEVWLAIVDDVPMPPVGYGNQFGAVELASESDCGKSDPPRSEAADPKDLEKCKKWYRQQLRYRTRFKRLFEYQWLLTPNYAEEAYATPAYEEIVRDYASDQGRYEEEIPKLLKPAEKTVQGWLQQYGGQPGYRFTVYIPWNALPASNTLDISRLRLLVEVFNPAPDGKKTGPYSTTAPGRKYGKVETFHLLELSTPKHYQLSACGGDLKVQDKYGDSLPGWFVPRVDNGFGWISKAFAITNEAFGYMYGPDGLSPVVHEQDFFFKGIDQGEWICGPKLTYKKDDAVHTFDAFVDHEGFNLKKLDNGSMLVKVGPRTYYSTFGSGACGACPRTDLRIFSIDKNWNLKKAIGLGGVIGSPTLESQDITVSTDWNTVTQYDGKFADQEFEKLSWSSTTYCRKGLEFEQCGKKNNVQPPNPPVLKDARNPR
jgi:hypothetical protein